MNCRFGNQFDPRTLNLTPKPIFFLARKAVAQ